MSELLSFIRQHVGASTNITIRHGYPPETIYFETFDPEKKLAELPFKLDGTQVTVEYTGAGEDGAKKEEVKAASLGGDGTSGSRPGPQRRISPPLKSYSNLSSTSSAKGINKDDPPDVTIAGRGILSLRVMPDDNSCLFRAISYVLSKGYFGVEELRSIVASTIQENPDKYDEAVLDKEPTEYCKWISKETSWGGGIELSILAENLGTEIAAVDVQTGSVIRFGEGNKQRAFLIYSGIHYDGVALAPYRNASPDSDISVFELDDQQVMAAAIELCAKLKAKHYHTDTQNFTLRCGTCGVGLKGQKAAV